MNTRQPYTVLQRNLILVGAALVILGSFLPWEVEGDFISTWRYGIQIFPVFTDNGGIVALLLGVVILRLAFCSEGIINQPAKWIMISAIALFLVSAYHVVDWLMRRVASSGIVGAPEIRIGLILVGIGSSLLLATVLGMNSKVAANYVQR